MLKPFRISDIGQRTCPYIPGTFRDEAFCDGGPLQLPADHTAVFADSFGSRSWDRGTRVFKGNAVADNLIDVLRSLFGENLTSPHHPELEILVNTFWTAHATLYNVVLQLLRQSWGGGRDHGRRAGGQKEIGGERAAKPEHTEHENGERERRNLVVFSHGERILSNS